MCPQGTKLQCDAVIPKVPVHELSLCTRNSISLMLGLSLGLKSLFEAWQKPRECAADGRRGDDGIK